MTFYGYACDFAPSTCNLNTEQYQNIEFSRIQIETLAETTANATMFKYTNTPCEEMNTITKMKDMAGKAPNILAQKDTNNEKKTIAKTKRISAMKIKKVSSTVADFVLSGVEITDEIISFMASELVLGDNDNNNKRNSCYVPYHHRVFTLMATLAAMQVKYLGVIDRYTVRGTAMSVLGCINLEWCKNRTFDRNLIESIAESAALSAMKQLYHSEEQYIMKESSAGLINTNSLLTSIKFPSYQRFSIWDKFVNLYSRSSLQSKIQNEVCSRIPKVMSKCSHLSMSSADSISVASCLSDSINSYSKTFASSGQHSSASKMSKKKANLAKEVQCLTSLIVDEIHNAKDIDEAFISKVFIKFMEMKNCYKFKSGLTYKRERVFLELAIRAVANVGKSKQNQYGKCMNLFIH